jgi:very-short-patch-repair endonuclease
MGKAAWLAAGIQAVEGAPMPRRTRGETTPGLVRAARDQRDAPTQAEARLWASLRNRGLAGLKFRRQHPFGQYVLDAFCVDAQLAVEVDGRIHLEPAQVERDRNRTEELTACGIRVLRFSNIEVEDDLPGVLTKIREAARAPRNPRPTLPSPERRPRATSGEGPGVRNLQPGVKNLQLR